MTSEDDSADGSPWHCVLAADFSLIDLGLDEAEAERHAAPGTFTQCAKHRGAALTAAALLVAESQAR